MRMFFIYLVRTTSYDVIRQSENTKYIYICLKLADSRNDINMLLYFNAEWRYFGTKVLLSV